MEISRNTGKEIFFNTINQAGGAFIKPDRSLAMLYEKTDDGYLCLLRKVGEATKKEEAILVNYDSVKAGIKQALHDKWLCVTYKEIKVITGENVFQVEDTLKEYDELRKKGGK